MRVAGLVVAGGAGERMARSGATVAKPLTLVRGMTLLEWNLFALLKARITDLHVAVSAREDNVKRFTQSRCHELATAVGAELSVIVEHKPLGSMGAAAFLQDRDAVLVVNADNLTSLDIRAILASHQANDAALTLAVHDQSFPIPFGEITVDGEWVRAYREKPTLTMAVCSAISVLSKTALADLRAGENINLPAFANRLLDGGAKVLAFRHNAPWIDVNELAMVERAEALVCAHAEAFERWSGQPDHESVSVVFSSPHGVLLDRIGNGAWCLPTEWIGVDENPLPAAAHIVESRLDRLVTFPNQLAVFDGIDVEQGGVTRRRVFSIDVSEGSSVKPGRWVRPESVRACGSVTPFVLRVLALWARH